MHIRRRFRYSLFATHQPPPAIRTLLSVQNAHSDGILNIPLFSGLRVFPSLHLLRRSLVLFQLRLLREIHVAPQVHPRSQFTPTRAIALLRRHQIVPSVEQDVRVRRLHLARRQLPHVVIVVLEPPPLPAVALSAVRVIVPEVRRAAVVAHADEVVEGRRVADRVGRHVEPVQRKRDQIGDLAPIPRHEARATRRRVVRKALEQQHQNRRKDGNALIQILLAFLVAEGAHLGRVHDGAEVEAVLQANRAISLEVEIPLLHRVQLHRHVRLDRLVNGRAVDGLQHHGGRVLLRRRAHHVNRAGDGERGRGPEGQLVLVEDVKHPLLRAAVANRALIHINSGQRVDRTGLHPALSKRVHEDEHVGRQRHSIVPHTSPKNFTLQQPRSILHEGILRRGVRHLHAANRALHAPLDGAQGTTHTTCDIGNCFVGEDDHDHGDALVAELEERVGRAQRDGIQKQNAVQRGRKDEGNLHIRKIQNPNKVCDQRTRL